MFRPRAGNAWLRSFLVAKPSRRTLESLSRLSSRFVLEARLLLAVRTRDLEADNPRRQPGATRFRLVHRVWFPEEWAPLPTSRVRRSLVSPFRPPSCRNWSDTD